MHCWGFNKQAYWLNHSSLIIDLNLSALPSFVRSRNYKPSFSSLSVEYSISSVGNSSCVWLSNCIPEIITWPMKESKFQEFQEALVMEIGKRSSMNEIITVKKQQGKGPGHFCYIVSALLPQATLQGLSFLLSLQLPSYVAQHLLITLNNTGMNIIW